jgi:hypothetical protein
MLLLAAIVAHALTHGNVVYSDENGHESPGSRLRYLAFLSEHDDGQSYRVASRGRRRAIPR